MYEGRALLDLMDHICVPIVEQSECVHVLDSLRMLKSQLEGSHYECSTPPSLHMSSLSQLKHLVLAHTPASMTEQHKAKMADLLADIFEGKVKTLLFVCVLTCPWYAGAQEEVSSQANRNILFVVYVAMDEHFFSLATPHERALLDNMDHVC